MDSAEVGVLAALKKAFSEIADVSAKGTADKQQQENEKLRAILLAIADRFVGIGDSYVQLGAEVQSALIELEPSLISFPEQPEHEPGDAALAEDLGFTPGDIGYGHKLRLIADFRRRLLGG